MLERTFVRMKLTEVADSFAEAMASGPWSIIIDSESERRSVFIECRAAAEEDFVRELSPKAIIGLYRRAGGVGLNLVCHIDNVALSFPEGVKHERLRLNALNFKLDKFRGMFQAEPISIIREADRSKLLLEDFFKSARKMFDELPIPYNGSFMDVDMWKWRVKPDNPLTVTQTSDFS
jgi:hypothetical protein